MNADLDDMGAMIFPYTVELIHRERPGVARRACKVCFPDGRVEHIGFVCSPRGTVHIPMPDGDTVCNHDATREGWWYLL